MTVNKNVEVEEEVDSDLQDLITSSSSSAAAENLHSKSGNQLPEYDNSTMNYPTRGPKRSFFEACRDILELICIRVCCLSYYTLAFLLANPLLLVTVLVLIVYGLLSLSHFTFNNQSIGVIEYDFSNIHSALDFDISKVDHWCIMGGDEKCRCEDPLHATPKMSKQWMQAHEADKTMIQSLSSKHDIDVVFVGQSVVEVMNGRVRGTDLTR